VLTPEQAAEYKQEPIVPVASNIRRSSPTPTGLRRMCDARLIAQFGQDNATEGGLQVPDQPGPALQAAANKALRDGLIAYDRRLGGWRGPVTTTSTTRHWITDWPTLLAKVARPPGHAAGLAGRVVLSTTDK